MKIITLSVFLLFCLNRIQNIYSQDTVGMNYGEKVFLLMYNDEYLAAIELIDEYLKQNDDLTLDVFSYNVCSRTYAKMCLGDHQGAIDDCNYGLQRDALSGELYCLRGKAKMYLQDFIGAITDFTQAIRYDDPEIVIIGETPFKDRAACKYFLEDYRGAMLDLNKYLELCNNMDDKALIIRGLSHYHLGNKENACLDFSKAGELGNATAYDFIQDFCK